MVTLGFAVVYDWTVGVPEERLKFWMLTLEKPACSVLPIYGGEFGGETISVFKCIFAKHELVLRTDQNSVGLRLIPRQC